MAQIELILAAAENGVIGAEGKMPWRVKQDLQRFKKLTWGFPIVMGRKTWESLPTKPLAGRKNIVLTRNLADAQDIEGAHCVATREEALAAAQGAEKLYIIGGGEIYRLFEADATIIHLTKILGSPMGDTYFHLQNPEAWRISERTPHPHTQPNTHAYEFITLERC